MVILYLNFSSISFYLIKNFLPHHFNESIVFLYRYHNLVKNFKCRISRNSVEKHFPELRISISFSESVSSMADLGWTVDSLHSTSVCPSLK